MTTRLTLVVATLSTVGLIVLGATSVDAAVRYMGAKNWQRLHTMNYAISALAILHVVLARGTYAEQYILTAIFFWLMVWRVLARYRLGANAKALAMLAVASCLVAAFLEAGFLWSRRGFDVSETLGYNFSLAILDVAYPPAWQVLAFGLLVALGAAGREALRLKAPSLAARARTRCRQTRETAGRTHAWLLRLPSECYPLARVWFCITSRKSSGTIRCAKQSFVRVFSSPVSLPSLPCQSFPPVRKPPHRTGRSGQSSSSCLSARVPAPISGRGFWRSGCRRAGANRL